MKIWSASAIRRYYLDPTIKQRFAARGGTGGPEGYYIVPHWNSGRHPAFGKISASEVGPFTSRADARNWSRQHMVEPETTGPTHRSRKRSD